MLLARNNPLKHSITDNPYSPQAQLKTLSEPVSFHRVAQGKNIYNLWSDCQPVEMSQCLGWRWFAHCCDRLLLGSFLLFYVVGDVCVVFECVCLCVCASSTVFVCVCVCV